ncbi:ATP-binding protein [bacterium]|nr:ATP-binding protein [bacterium]
MKIGIVLGTKDATPFEFYIEVDSNQSLQVDDIIVTTSEYPRFGRVTFYGIVDQVISRLEGLETNEQARFHSQGLFDANLTYYCHVVVTRTLAEDGTSPKVPPRPGSDVRLADIEETKLALYFDKMEKKKIPCGLLSNNTPAYLDLDFLLGIKGGHVNISGKSGVATKTSYATFLLYSYFSSLKEVMEAYPELGSVNTHAIIFNVKGEDLLFLDKPNTKLSEKDRKMYEAMGLPAKPFGNVRFYAPPRPKRGQFETILPNTESRIEGVNTFAWTIREMVENDLLWYLFSPKELSDTSQLYLAIRMATKWLNEEMREGLVFHSLRGVIQALEEQIDKIMDRVAVGTRDAFMRRLYRAEQEIGSLIVPEVLPFEEVESYSIDWRKAQVNVVDIHRLSDRAKYFTVGAILKSIVAEKENTGMPWPLVFIVLDELNKYAPISGDSPIADIILDIAERGRSLGIILIGAQQTASEVTHRVVSNASIRVCGNMDASEAEHSVYGYLGSLNKKRVQYLTPGQMFVYQPDVPQTVLVQFPMPAWATKYQESIDTGYIEEEFMVSELDIMREIEKDSDKEKK